jgi:hypothetical protein
MGQQEGRGEAGEHACYYRPLSGATSATRRRIRDRSSWKDVKVRRRSLYVEKSVDAGTQWVVLEPNDEIL